MLATVGASRPVPPQMSPVFLLLALPCALAATLTSGTQYSALTSLFVGTNGASWTNKWPVPSATDACTFYGVTCDASANVK